MTTAADDSASYRSPRLRRTCGISSSKRSPRDRPQSIRANEPKPSRSSLRKRGAKSTLASRMEAT